MKSYEIDQLGHFLLESTADIDLLGLCYDYPQFNSFYAQLTERLEWPDFVAQFTQYTFDSANLGSLFRWLKITHSEAYMSLKQVFITPLYVALYLLRLPKDTPLTIDSQTVNDETIIGIHFDTDIQAEHHYLYISPLPLDTADLKRLLNWLQERPVTKVVLAGQGFIGEAYYLVSWWRHYQLEKQLESLDQSDQLEALKASHLWPALEPLLDCLEVETLPGLERLGSWGEAEITSALQKNEIPVEADEFCTAIGPWLENGTTSTWREVVTRLLQHKHKIDEQDQELLNFPAELINSYTTGINKYKQFITKYQYKVKVQNYITSIWRMNAPAELKTIATLVDKTNPDDSFFASFKDDREANQRALEWGLEELDNDWQIQIMALLLLLDERGLINRVGLRKRIEQWSWQRFQEIWPDIDLANNFDNGAEIKQGLATLGLERNPFGPTEAEKDRYLIDKDPDGNYLASRTVEKYKLDMIQSHPFTIVQGDKGIGKTALALLWTYEQIFEIAKSKIFPVYIRFTLDDIATNRDELYYKIGKGIGRHLLYYFSALPSQFLRIDDTKTQSQIAMIIDSEINRQWGRFYEAGLVKSDLGRQLLDELKTILGNDPIPSTIPNHDLTKQRIRQARPATFDKTVLFIDIQTLDNHSVVETNKAVLEKLLNAVNDLTNYDTITAVLFLPSQLWEEIEPVSKANELEIIWSDEELNVLLENSLALTGKTSFNELCAPDARNADSRLVKAAQGNPRQLLALGNQLIVQAGTQSDEGQITADGLDKILGPVTPETNDN